MSGPDPNAVPPGEPGRGPGPAPSVLVLTAALGRTGVPVVLARYLAALDGPRRARFRVIARRGGPVADDIRRLGVEVVTLEPPDRRSAGSAAVAAVSAVAGPRRGRMVAAALAGRLRRLAGRPDVVLVHGGGGIEMAGLLGPIAPVVVHLHELSMGLRRCGPPEVVRDVLAAATSVMAVCEPVADLARSAGARGPVHIVGGVADASVPPRPPAPESGSVTVAREAPTVLGVGEPGWRKGSDRMVALARALARVEPAARVVWVGGQPKGAERTWLGTDDPVRWVRPVADPWEVTGDPAVVVIPSREDPLPLVALEAGLRRRAVVATSTGGLTDLLADGRGRVVGTHDLPGLLDGVLGFLRRTDEAQAAGEALARWVLARHVPDAVVPSWYGAIVAAAGGDR